LQSFLYPIHSLPVSKAVINLQCELSPFLQNNLDARRVNDSFNIGTGKKTDNKHRRQFRQHQIGYLFDKFS